MSNIMPFRFSLHSLTKQDTIHQIMATNTVSCQYGLSLKSVSRFSRGTPGLRKIIFILSREGSNLGDFP